MSESSCGELRIPLRQMTLAAKTWGSPADPPMLALHGWLDNAGSFDRLAPLMEGHYLVAIDMAGHGCSDHRPPASWYPYADYLDDIAEVITWFGWSSVDLLGHSLGATLLSTYAAIRPQQVRRLLLIEGLGPLTQTAEKTLEQLRRAHSARASFRGDGLRLFASLDEAIAARRRSGSLSEPAARCIVERGVKAVDGSERGFESSSALSGQEIKSRDEDSDLERLLVSSEAERKSCEKRPDFENVHAFSTLSWSSDPQLTIPSSSRLTEEQLAAVLPGIEAPTCLVLAEPNAPYLAPAMMEARIALVADIEVVRLAGTHHLHLEDPQPVAAILHEFLQRHPIAGQASSEES